ncbi:MAG: hypothetical protein JWQ48_2317 [Conexibacter sp.]|nr:hypothetical protein [Conexibacter sp.]
MAPRCRRSPSDSPSTAVTFQTDEIQSGSQRLFDSVSVNLPMVTLLSDDERLCADPTPWRRRPLRTRS